MSDVLRGEVQAVSLVSLKVEAEKVARQFFGTDCVAVELSKTRLDNSFCDMALDGRVIASSLTFSANFVARVSHSFGAFDLLSGVRLCDICGIHSDYWEGL